MQHSYMTCCSWNRRTATWQPSQNRLPPMSAPSLRWRNGWSPGKTAKSHFPKRGDFGGLWSGFTCPSPVPRRLSLIITRTQPALLLALIRDTVETWQSDMQSHFFRGEASGMTIQGSFYCPCWYRTYSVDQKLAVLVLLHGLLQILCTAKTVASSRCFSSHCRLQELKELKDDQSENVLKIYDDSTATSDTTHRYRMGWHGLNAGGLSKYLTPKLVKPLTDIS